MLVMINILCALLLWVKASVALTLFTEFSFGSGLTTKNRIVLPPLSRCRSTRTQVPNEVNVQYYTQRACAGFIVSEGTVISKGGMGWAGVPAIYEPQHIEGWKKVTKAVHDAESIIFCQLWHAGRCASSYFDGIQPISASAIPAQGQVGKYDLTKVPFEVPRAVRAYEITGIVKEFRHAARNAKIAGFDGVELHCANGYLLDNFLQSCSNQRTDKYGGSFENRFRILGEVLDAVQSAFPSTRIGVRFSPNGIFNTMGSADNFDAFQYYVSELQKYNLAYVHIMDGVDYGFHNLCRQFKLADARKVFDNCIIGNVGYCKLTAEGAINTGAVDLIAFGRPFIANPDLPARLINDWPLAEANKELLYKYPGFPDGDGSVGYTDYPNYISSQ